MSRQVKQVLKELESIKPGDLVAVDWCDASTGKSSMNGGSIDVPVRSWGVFLGVIDGRVKHVILAQNSFRFTDSAFDLDYTAIPVGWTVEVKVLAAGHVKREVAEDMIQSFARSTAGQARTNTAGLRSPRTSLLRLRLHLLLHHSSTSNVKIFGIHRMQRLSVHARDN